MRLINRSVYLSKIFIGQSNLLIRKSRNLSSHQRSMSQSKLQQSKPRLDMKSRLEKIDNPHNIDKDLILFHSDQSKFFRLMNLFAITQFGFWSYMGFTILDMNSVEISEETKNDKNLPWWRKYDFAYYKTPMAVTTFIIGKFFGSLSSMVYNCNIVIVIY